ncbi:MAG: relaxase/mobilization nuclease domain-containing protein [Pseudomonadota bacterium]
MILKGSQRAGGQNLAVHLMRGDDNEHIEVHELRGFMADDLKGAFKEAEAVSRGTKCQQYLFSLSLNPPETEQVSIEDFEAAIGRIEQKLGLADHPRAIVFHEKEGRRHAHAVWSRIDAATMTAKNLPHYKLKLRDISRALYLEHDWTMPRGLMNVAERDPANFTLAEWQQAKRNGADPREIKQALQMCWRASDGVKSLQAAMQERGFYLARGDRRGFVAIDYKGEVYALPRALGFKTKEVRAVLGEPDHLRSVAETRRHIAERMTLSVKRHIDEARLLFSHKAAALDHEKRRMVTKQRSERAKFYQAHKDRRLVENKARSARLPRGLSGLWARVTGRHQKIRKQNEAEATKCDQRDLKERNAVITAQLRERRTLQMRIKQSRCEQAEILRDLRRDIFTFLEWGRAKAQDHARLKRRRRMRGMKLDRS